MSVQVKISANGRICIPADVRARLGLSDGDSLLLDETRQGLVLRTRAQSLKRAQALSRKLLAGTNASVDDFLAERRAEARREAEEL